jgi:cytochrome c oxidase assembly protein subunit 15
VNSALHRLALVAAIVAFAVIILGAFVRLSHAGLGCPDWPGCYGHITWPEEPHEIHNANQAFPDRPVETHKAWREMVHRYLAGSLVLLVLAINVLAWKTERREKYNRALAGVLLGVILFQAALGMWTVTLKLVPMVVMGHLLGGLTTFGLLLWLAWRTSPRPPRPDSRALAPFRVTILVALVVLATQISLGGWTSANYAALACPDFPTCQGSYWPAMDFPEGFVMWREIGVDYEGGLLDLPARTAIHVAHRIGAAVTLLVLGFLALRLVGSPATRGSGMLLALLLTAQVSLGALNVVLYLPLANAVAHNAVGALLLAMMLSLAYRSTPRHR